MANPAPLYNDLALGPDSGKGYWLTAQDGVRIRIGVWNSGTKGTVLIFPGRTEYIEKYGKAAKMFALQGYSSLAVDWRGQGLADRLQADRNIGHVVNFIDYQYDVQAVLLEANKMGLPKPYYLVAHSMGACIALRSLMQNMPVQAVTISAPMWGILFHPPTLRPIAWAISTMLHPFTASNMRSPSTAIKPYVATEQFTGNNLTHDEAMYDMMAKHLREVPDLALGGPSLRWLNEALREMRYLNAQPSPNFPVLCFLGSKEDIVDPRRVQSRVDRWPGARLEIMQDANHEIMMELPKVRYNFYSQACTFFKTHHPIA